MKQGILARLGAQIDITPHPIPIENGLTIQDAVNLNFVLLAHGLAQQDGKFAESGQSLWITNAGAGTIRPGTPFLIFNKFLCIFLAARAGPS